MVLLGGHGMVYGIAWRGLGLHLVWLGRMTCTWNGLAGMAWYMVCSIGYVMTYDVVWQDWHCNWPGGHRMVYRIGMVWSVGHDIVYRNGLAR